MFQTVSIVIPNDNISLTNNIGPKTKDQRHVFFFLGELILIIHKIYVLSTGKYLARTICNKLPLKDEEGALPCHFYKNKETGD